MESLKMLPTRVRVTSILKKAIYAGEYQSGQELSLTGIAEQLGISRTPVREAFQALEAEGLITLRMNKGAIVNSIDASFIREIFEMRTLLEAEAAARAAERGMDAEQLDKLTGRVEMLFRLLREPRDNAAAGAAALSAGERQLYEDLNQELHMALWEAAGNRRLRAYLMELWNGPSVGRDPADELEHFRLSTEEHLRILAAVRDRDPETARTGMTRHLTRSMENMLRNYNR